MTVESVLEKLKQLERQRAQATAPEETLDDAIKRESARLGMKIVPVKRMEDSQ